MSLGEFLSVEKLPSLRIGTNIRVNKQSFDNWFAAV